MTDLYYAAACQTAFTCPTTHRDIASRTRRMCEIVEDTVIGYEPFFDVRLGHSHLRPAATQPIEPAAIRARIAAAQGRPAMSATRVGS